MTQINLTGPHHHLAVSIDESSLITIRHRRLHDELMLSSLELRELVARAPEILAESDAAFQHAIDGGPFAGSDIERLGGTA